MICAQKISYYRLLILLLINLIVSQGSAQQNDHDTHVKEHSNISRDSLELINQMFNKEWNQWRDSLFGLEIEENIKIGEVVLGMGNLLCC